MEESSEAHMDTGVSSTTDDVQEVEEVASSHRKVETVITVESINEEDMSPKRTKPPEDKSTEKPESAVPVSKLHSDVTIKKIIIKSPLKDLQVRPIQKSPTKPPVEAQKVVGNEASLCKPVQPSTSQKPQPADSSSKVDLTSFKKDVEKTVQSTTVNSSDSQKITLKSPVKDSKPQESTKEAEPKNPSKEIQVLNKEAPVIIIAKNKITKTPVKEQTVVSSAKDGSPKVLTLTGTSAKLSIIDSSDKPSPANDRSPTEPALEKETPKTPVKGTPVKPPHKEVPSKQTPTKDSPAKQTVAKETKETEINVQSKEEQPIKTTPSKEPPLKASDNALDKTEKSAEPKKTQDNNVKNKNISLSHDQEASNDSQMETNSDTSEKEHNKSISRELRSLINSAKESKIISECTQLTSKTRKSRTPLDTSLNTSADAEKIHAVRRGSDNSQISNSSEKSDKPTVKRSMRSQNPEFVTKVKTFLNSVSGKSNKPEDEISDEESSEKAKGNEKETPSLPKKKKTEESTPVKSPMEKITAEKGSKLRQDPYCWRCHWGVVGPASDKPQAKAHCTVCPRSFHIKCLTVTERSKIQPEKAWVCPECVLILQAESSESRSPAMKKISLGMLCDLLKYALERMMEVNGVEPFMSPVDRTEFPDYDSYVVHPMDLSLIKQQIEEGLYGSTEAFLADVQWILHNSVIFNTLQAKLTGGARALVRSCRAEMGEIEACPECYAAAHARRPTWFTDVCSTPHILLWAKLKGFPYWPAKGMSVNSSGLVDVRFFGAHDRAWVPARDCFLFSEKDPNNFRTKRQDILDSMQEAEQHIRNISRKYGKFVYPPFKTTLDPTKLNEQLKLMIPSFEGEVRAQPKEKPTSSPANMKDTRRSNSKSSKGSLIDGEASESEENSMPSRKMASGAEIAREEDDFAIEKDNEKNKIKPMDVDSPQTKENDKSLNEASRKRRRSVLEEAVITIIDSSKEKRRRRQSVPCVDRTNKDKQTTEKKDDAKETPQAKEQDEPKTDVIVKTVVPSTSAATTAEKKVSPKVTPIRVIAIAKVMKSNEKVNQHKISLSKEETKTPKPKSKPDKVNKEKDVEKANEATSVEKSVKRRSSKNKSLNNNNASITDKKVDKTVNTSNNEKSKDKDSTKEKSNGSDTDKSTSSSTHTAKPTKDRIQFDDDTSLAVLAREAKNTVKECLPTISSVRSLSGQSNSGAKSLEVTVEAAQDSSIFTPTSTDNVRNMKEAVNKLQKLKENDPPPVGRVGVRAFARMTSPPEKETRPKDVQVEIKTEPMEFEESDRQLQDKIDLMSAFKLRPVNPPTSTANLRDVRVNKVVVTPVTRKGATPPQPATGMRAKKTFPQPKKPDEGRSELTSKNSMVYIPIQPPATQAPAKPGRPVPTITTATPPQNKNVNTLCIASNMNNVVNTITSPLPHFSSPSLAVTPTNSSNPIQTVATIGPVPPVGAMTTLGGLPTVGPTVGQVPSTVHTMPLITSVNGQWTFSLQPVLSVGGVDNSSSPPMVNGIADRSALLPLGAGPAGAVLVPAAPPVLASPAHRVADPAPGEPPRLQQRPPLVNPLDAGAPLGTVPPPSSVGPLTAKLNQNAVKMTDFFRTLLEDSIEKVDEPAAQVAALKLQLEQIKWRHQQAMEEAKHNHELTLSEMRSSFEKEKLRLVAETRRQGQVELEAAVKLTKAKQWCANCNQEAQFYCCWNTAYCDYPCQRAHWATHYAHCAQHRTQDNNGAGDNNGNPPEGRLQQAPENLPKTTAAPNLAPANKLQPSRMYTQEQPPQKTSIIVSMVDDNTGNQTMKCVGTYKPNATQVSPLIINKQIMSNEESSKKVVTSGGYLIVGASNSTNSTTITPARRAPAIQYIS